MGSEFGYSLFCCLRPSIKKDSLCYYVTLTYSHVPYNLDLNNSFLKFLWEIPSPPSPCRLGRSGGTGDVCPRGGGGGGRVRGAWSVVTVVVSGMAGGGDVQMTTTGHH